LAGNYKTNKMKRKSKAISFKDKKAEAEPEKPYE